jgi:hypothetical protein
MKMAMSKMSNMARKVPLLGMASCQQGANLPPILVFGLEADLLPKL